MDKKNSVFIATSVDGYIADRKGRLKWLEIIPNPNQESMGYYEFMEGMDALVMGRVTFETVLGFGIEWPYKKPVYVLSNTLQTVSDELRDKVFLKKGPLKKVLEEIYKIGHYKLYIDGGSTIQSFLREDLIDEMIITQIPVLLGGGIPLFGSHEQLLEFECIETKILLDKIVQNHFRRVR